MSNEMKREEIGRRFTDRNVKGYFGANARAWVRLLIRQIRQSEVAK